MIRVHGRHAVQHATPRPVAGIALIVLICALSGLLLVAKGSPRWQEPSRTSTSPTASTAAETMPLPTPEAR